MDTDKIFIACPVSKYIKNGMFTDVEFKAFIQRLYINCKEYTQNVFLALEREQYGKRLMVDTCTELDYKEMGNSNLVIALPDDSLGVSIELGWASAMGKNILLVLDRNRKYSPLVTGLSEITDTEIVWYNGKLTKEVLIQIISFLKPFYREGIKYND